MLNRRLTLAKAGKLQVEFSADEGKLSASEIMRQVTLTHEEQVPTSGKGRPWNYYISEPLKFNPSSVAAETDKEASSKL